MKYVFFFTFYKCAGEQLFIGTQKEWDEMVNRTGGCFTINCKCEA